SSRKHRVPATRPFPVRFRTGALGEFLVKPRTNCPMKRRFWESSGAGGKQEETLPAVANRDGDKSRWLRHRLACKIVQGSVIAGTVKDYIGAHPRCLGFT